MLGLARGPEDEAEKASDFSTELANTAYGHESHDDPVTYVLHDVGVVVSILPIGAATAVALVVPVAAGRNITVERAQGAHRRKRQSYPRICTQCID